MESLDALLERVAGLSPADQKELAETAKEATKHMVFIPSEGPQTKAYLSGADVLLFGGSPGGGKTALECGLALNEHHRSLIVRKSFVDLAGVLHTLDNIVGQENCYVGGNRPVYRKPGGGIIEFMGLGDSMDSKQGNPHDLICVDEAAQVPEYQVRMLMGWMRSNIEGQRCRMVLASNPPLDSTGDWLIEFFGPWLDPAYPNPAEEGELRYYLPNEEIGFRECSKDDFIELQGVRVTPQSRTYISSKFTDNPFYNAEEYAKSLAGLPDSARNRLISGNFMMDRADGEWQTIPTDWVKQAQARWKTVPPPHVPMCTIGVDVAQGGQDNTVLAIRHGGWYAPLVVVPGKETPDGKAVAGHVIKHRRNQAHVIVDLGGGWGGDAYGHLKENMVESSGYLGVNKSRKLTKDKKLGFFNVRAEAYWKFREALDPSQEGGSPIALPPDSILVADLCAPTYEIGANGIKLESKEDVTDRLKRSTDRGDAVVMAWFAGLKQENTAGGWTSNRGFVPQVITRKKR
jgi:hypothetical protein